MFTIDWTAEKCLELIAEYKKRPILWEKTTIGHKNRQKKALAWTEIAKKIGCTRQEVKRKYSVLLTQYRRETKKILVRFHECPQDPYSPSWYAFKAFAFLEDARQPRKINKVQPTRRNFPKESKMISNNILSKNSNENRSSIESIDSKMEEQQGTEYKNNSFYGSPENIPTVVLHTNLNQDDDMPEIIWEESLPATEIVPSTDETKTNNISGLEKIDEKSMLLGKGTKRKKELRNHLQMLMKKLSNEDEFDFIGNNTTSKLRLMETSQRIIAEKLIGDVLFYGQMNKLSNSAEVIPSKDRIENEF